MSQRYFMALELASKKSFIERSNQVGNILLAYNGIKSPALFSAGAASH